MLRSMTGFGRSMIEDDEGTQTWEIRSVNNRHMDLKWRLPLQARGFEARFERVVRKAASRGRVEISLALHTDDDDGVVRFHAGQAASMLDSLADLAAERGELFEPDYNALLNVPSLWRGELDTIDEDLEARLEAGLAAALDDWNEARAAEGKLIGNDIMTRVLRLEEWVLHLEEQAPGIKEERIAVLRERLSDALVAAGSDLEENRFLQEVLILSDKLDVSEELTRLAAHLERLRELLGSGVDAGRRLDFTLQECFREITTCGNKIQDSQLSRLVVDFKNELEKCREQVQNME